tara:strand:+ start:72 stop:290 length:219 start_codon:yes stop_codon:yes gene_type:complete
MSNHTETVMFAKSLDFTQNNFDAIKEYLISTLVELEKVEKELEYANKILDCNHIMFSPDEEDEYMETIEEVI